MASWTDQQLSVLMTWLDENEENAEKTIWAQRYYNALYLLLFIPSVAINSIIGTIRNECSNGTESDASEKILTLIIINIALNTFDKYFNFGKKAADFEQYSNMYQSFSDEITEEIVKPDSQKRNGTQFYHDMNIKKQRLNDQTESIPWLIEQLYSYKKNKNEKLESDKQTSTKHDSCIIKTPNDTMENTIPRLVENPIASNSYDLLIKEKAAITIQKYWFKYCIRKNKSKKSLAKYKHSLVRMYAMFDIIDRAVDKHHAGKPLGHVYNPINGNPNNGNPNNGNPINGNPNNRKIINIEYAETPKSIM